MRRRKLISRYTLFNFLAQLHNAKIPPLEALLPSLEQKKEQSAFDEKSDKFLEEYALRKLRERQKG